MDPKRTNDKRDRRLFHIDFYGLEEWRTTETEPTIDRQPIRDRRDDKPRQQGK